jgi:hypothetical protein
MLPYHHQQQKQKHHYRHHYHHGTGQIYACCSILFVTHMQTLVLSLLALPTLIPFTGASASFNLNSLLPSTPIEASMDQIGMALPPWAIRAGGRKEIYFNPSQV